MVIVEKSRRLGFGFVLPACFGDGELAVVAQGFTMGDDVVPDETSRRVRQRIHPTIGHAMDVTAWKTGKRFFQILIHDSAVGPLMTISAEDSGAIGVIE